MQSSRRSAPVEPASEFPSWPVALLTVPIAFRAAVFFVAIVVSPWQLSPSRPIPAWLQIGEAALFAGLGAFLLKFGRADRRAWALGLFVLDAGTTLLNPVIRSIAEPSWILWLAASVRVDAFQAATVWFFASVFPRSATDPALARRFVAGTYTAFALGALLVIADGIGVSGVAAGSALGTVAGAFRREAAGTTDWFFTVQFLLMAPLLLLMRAKLRSSGPDDRRRFWWLVIGMTAGYAPLFLSTLLLSVLPWFGINMRSQPYYRSLILASIVSMSLVPLAATYAALVQRTLDVGIVLRSAVQYLLARSVVRVIAAVPFAVLLLLIVFNRQSSIDVLLSGASGVLFGALAAASVAAAVGRKPLLAAIDRRFFRQQLDAQSTLLDVTDAVRQTGTVQELRDTLNVAIDSAIHPETFVTFIAGTDDRLHAIDADLPALPRQSALAQILAAGSGALFVDGAAALVERLPPSDTEWLRRSCAVVILPMLGSRRELLGAIVVGEKQSEQPYRSDERKLLGAVADAGSLALERIFTAAESSDRSAKVVEVAGRECVECGKLHESDTIACTCGGILQRAMVPAVFADRLRFERRLGAGAMGIVYQAFDLRLAQPRAVKTLPSGDPATIARMQHEARAMAAVRHPGLATVFSLEAWRGVPLLVMELLDGGTLADRLRSGALPPNDVIRIGVDLAHALSAVHGIGMLHRDIKPSNIGFGSGHQPKLLDFGLARTAAAEHSPTTGLPRDGEGSTWSSGLSTGPGGLRGTPAYMSPELLSGHDVSVSDDLWALSVTLLEASTGTNPFRGESVAATAARVLTHRDRIAAAAGGLSPAMANLFHVLLGAIDQRPATAAKYVDLLARIE